MQIPWKHVNEYQNLNVPSLNIKRLTGFFLLGRSPVGGGRFGPNSWDLGWGILGQICASAAEPVGKTLYYAWCQNDWQFKDLIYKKWVEKVPFTPGLVCLNGCLCWLKFSVFRGGGMWCNAFFGTLKYPAQTTLLRGRSVCTLLLCFRNPAIKASKNAIKFKLLAQLCKFLWAIVQKKTQKRQANFMGSGFWNHKKTAEIMPPFHNIDCPVPNRLT